MRKHILTILLYLFIAIVGNSQHPKIVKFDEVNKYLQSRTDTTYILNFWATWCKPCIKEMPHFDAITTSEMNKHIKVVFISLDFASDMEKRLIPFMAERNLASEVILLDDQDYDSWVPIVEEKWSGAIPFTLITRGKDHMRYWKEGVVSEKELHKILNNQFGYEEN